MKRWAAVGLCCAVLAVIVPTACSSAKSKKLTQDNIDKVLEEIKNSKDLTVEEVGLLQAALLRRGFSGQKLNGETVGQLIQEQREWAAKIEKQQNEAEEQKKQLAAEAAAKQAEMLKQLSLTVCKLEPYSDLFPGATMGFAYQNTSAKDIRAFEGHVIISDVLGNRLEEIPIKILSPTKAGSKATRLERYPYMAYTSLKDKKLADIKVDWQPGKILFADGTQMTAE